MCQNTDTFHYCNNRFWDYAKDTAECKIIIAEKYNEMTNVKIQIWDNTFLDPHPKVIILSCSGTFDHGDLPMKVVPINQIWKNKNKNLSLCWGIKPCPNLVGNSNKKNLQNHHVNCCDPNLGLLWNYEGSIGERKHWFIWYYVTSKYMSVITCADSPGDKQKNKLRSLHFWNITNALCWYLVTCILWV